MAYLPQWERLSDALDRVMAAGKLSKLEAQTDIRQAIADGVVQIRVKLGRHTTRFDHDVTSLDPNWESGRDRGPGLAGAAPWRLLLAGLVATTLFGVDTSFACERDTFQAT